MPFYYQNIPMLPFSQVGGKKFFFTSHQAKLPYHPSWQNLVVDESCHHTTGCCQPHPSKEEEQWGTHVFTYSIHCLVLFPTEGKYDRLSDSTFVKSNPLRLSPSIARESIWTHTIEQDTPVCAVWHGMVSFPSTFCDKKCGEIFPQQAKIIPADDTIQFSHLNCRHNQI